MARPIIPRHEPELIAAFSLKFAAAKRATRIILDGVRLHSQRGNADEYARVAAALAALPTAWRGVIDSVVWGDTTVCIELTFCTPEAAVGIVQALAQTLKDRDVIVNGLWFDGDLASFKSTIGMPWTTRPEVRCGCCARPP